MRTFDENTKRKKRQDIGKISVRYRKGMKTAQVTHYAVSLASVSVVYDWKFRKPFNKRNHKILPQSKANQNTIIVDRCMTAMTIMMENGDDDDDDENIAEEIAASSSSSSMTIWVGGTSALAQTYYVDEIILLSSSSSSSSNNSNKNNYDDARNNDRYFILASPDPSNSYGRDLLLSVLYLPSRQQRNCFHTKKKFY